MASHHINAFNSVIIRKEWDMNRTENIRQWGKALVCTDKQWILTGDQHDGEMAIGSHNSINGVSIRSDTDWVRDICAAKTYFQSGSNNTAPIRHKIWE
jgi:hypothetical protein